MDAFCVDDDLNITGQFPFWTKVESASAKLFMDGKLVSRPMNVDFISQHKAFDKPDHVNVSSQDDYDLFTFKWTPFPNSKEVVPHILHVKIAPDLNATENPYTINRTVLGAIPNNGSFSWNIQSQHFVFIQLIDKETNEHCQTKENKSVVPISASRSSGCPFQMTEIEIAPKRSRQCSDFLETEKQLATVTGEKWFNYLPACPRRPPTNRGRLLFQSDADYAKKEIQNHGNWKYDPCCSEKTSDKFKAFCNNCDMNKNAEFCIVSKPIPRVLIRSDTISGRESNQCCYDKSGSLLTDPHGGRSFKEFNGRSNFIAHYETDRGPYLSCCKQRKHNDTECEKFMKYRPVVIGENYVPSYITMAIVQRDPHFSTLDGFQYTFNGLGVYTMLVSEFAGVTLQVSMRRMGEGTVLSGFALKDSAGSLVEAYLPPNGHELQVMLKGETFKTHRYSEIEMKGVEIVEVSDSEFVFTSIDTGLSVKVLITDSSILNIAVIPHLMMVDRVMGLLGNFDGDSENDLLLMNGTVLPTNCTLDEIHHNFGESWRVKEDDWLFSMQFALKIATEINSGMPYEPSYEPTFKSKEEERRINDACDNDQTCVLDVSLTKNFTFASTAKIIKSMKEKHQADTSGFDQAKATAIRKIRTQRPEYIAELEKAWREGYAKMKLNQP